MQQEKLHFLGKGRVRLSAGRRVKISQEALFKNMVRIVAVPIMRPE